MSRVLELYLDDEEGMMALGGRLALAVIAPCILFLHGDLGAGKTTLVRGFLRGLGHQGAVRSPTYTLVEPYELPQGRYYHFDLYRLADPEELEYLGIRDCLDGEAVALFEWPEQGEGVLPAADLSLHIHYRLPGRHLRLEAHSAQGEAALGRLGG